LLRNEKLTLFYFLLAQTLIDSSRSNNHSKEETMSKPPGNDDEHGPGRPLMSAQRRSVLFTLMGAAALTACGGGSSNPAPVTAASLSSGTSPATPGTAPARLTLSGATMLYQGKPIVLRGINEGTWGKMKSFDAGVIAGQGATAVRVLIRWWGAYGRSGIDSRVDNPDNGNFDQAHLDRFLMEIQWCLDAGLWVIPAIDSDCGQNGLQDAETIDYCDPEKHYKFGHNFWTDPAQRAAFKQAWIYLAGKLKNYQRIAFYELLPEPLGDHGPDYAAEVSAFYKELMVAIEDQAGDNRTPFLIGPRDAYNITLCDEAYLGATRWINRVVYTGNLFIRTGGTVDENLANLDERLGALKNMRKTRNVPVFIQQLGVRSGDDPTQFYLDAALKRVTNSGIGFTGWQWRQNTTNRDEYAIVVEDANGGPEWTNWPVLNVYSRYWRI